MPRPEQLCWKRSDGLLEGKRGEAAPRGCGRRCPAGAHTGAVCALRRLRCAHHPGAGAAKLAAFAALSPLRQWPRVRQRSAHLRARPQTGGHSHPGTSPPPGSTCRSNQRLGIPAVVRQPLFCQGVCAQAAARRVRRREAQRPWPRARRASSTDLSHLFEWRERSERSELCDRPRPRASQESRCKAPTASPKRCGLSAHALVSRGATNEICAQPNNTKNRDAFPSASWPTFCKQGSQATQKWTLCSKAHNAVEKPVRYVVIDTEPVPLFTGARHASTVVQPATQRLPRTR